MRGPTERTDREKEARINEFRLARGMTIKELADLVGSSPGEIAGLSSGTRSPVYHRATKYHYEGQLRPVALKLASVLRTSPEELFPRYVCMIENWDDQEPLVTYQLIDHSVGDYTRRSSDPNQILLKAFQNSDVMHGIVSVLNIRETMVILKRFQDGLTLDEIATLAGFSTKERVRQIEAKALRKLRGWMRANDADRQKMTKHWTFHNKYADKQTKTRMGVKA